MNARFLLTLNLILTLAMLSGCSDVDDHDHHDHHDHEHEVMTTVILTFTAQGSGEIIEARWADPEADGSPVIDSIALLDSENYDLAISILNELEDPAEEVTPEIAEEELEHQLFFVGSAVSGPAGTGSSAVVTHAYDDTDSEGNPIGLANTITTDATGSGVMTVVLRHMPYQDGNSVKTGSLAADVAANGIDALPGASDFEVDFDLEVL
ncbi:MAG: hypothetical protein CMP23_10315 [Rickettsiales bacterium]|nr:hypothetical protein [Rickettsiales bacterium]|tara:strand:+ start:2080 stop:2706 length:627 start_codon:yes stop_codon:yes gene_type:complete